MKKYDFIILTDSLTEEQDNKIKQFFKEIRYMTGFNALLNPSNLDDIIFCKVLIYFANIDVNIYKVDTSIKFEYSSFITITDDITQLNDRHTCIDIVPFTILNELFYKSKKFKLLGYKKSSYSDRFEFEFNLKRYDLKFTIPKYYSNWSVKFNNKVVDYTITDWSWMHTVYPKIFVIKEDLSMHK